MSLTEPTAPAMSGAGETDLSPRPSGPAGDARHWADDDRLDELFSAWARAAVVTDDQLSRPLPAEPAAPPAPPEPEPFAWPAFDAAGSAGADPDVPAAAREVLPLPAEPVPAAAVEVVPRRAEPVTAWSRADDDVIPTVRRSRWGRRR